CAPGTASGRHTCQRRSAARGSRTGESAPGGVPAGCRIGP
ncbi:unnamed protein product, partial [Gulo gulo]